MKTIQLTISEFLNFKKIIKDKYTSSIKGGKVEITCNIKTLSIYGYI